MKVPYINCQACKARLDGPFEPPHVMPPDTCPKCGQATFTTEVEGFDFATALKELLAQLNTAEQKPRFEDVVKKIVEKYAEAQHIVPKAEAALIMLDACSMAFWMANRNAVSNKHLLN